MHNTLLAIILGLSPVLASAQRFYFDNIGVNEGLPASKVYSMLEDPSGLIWVGTEAGLCRYDGISVEEFKPGNGVAANGARSLFRDREGRVWAGHLGGGVTVYDGKHFQEVLITDLLSSKDIDITGIGQDVDGHIWLSTFGSGAVQITQLAADGTVTGARFGMDQGVNDRIAGITTLHDGTLCFIEAPGTVVKLDPAKDTFTPFRIPGLPDIHRVITLFEDSKGGIWAGTNNGGAYRLDPATGKTLGYDIGNGLPGNTVVSMGEDADGHVWIGTWDGGAARIEKDGIRTFNLSNGLHGLSVRCILRDREGNMLLGTQDNGLDIFKGTRFVSFTEADGLVDPQVWAVLQDAQGRIWFGTNGGISIFDADQHSTARVKNMTMQQGDLTSNQVRSLRQDPRGSIWIGTENGGLIEFDPRMYRFRSELTGSIPGNNVTALEVDLQGDIWVGTANGLVRFKPGGVPTWYRTDDGLAGNNVMALYRDPKGVIWVGSALRGVTRIENGVAKPLDVGRSFSATCFVLEGKSRLWVGTEGQGVLVIEDGKITDTYTMDEGLLSNTIKSLNVDANGHVWVGTNRGLSEWRQGTSNFASYTKRAGFTGIEVKANATCVTRSGEMWFGTSTGATRVAQERNVSASRPLPVFLRGLRINLEARDMEDGLSVGHNDRNIRIAYGSVSLSDPGAVRFSYMLDGLEKDWQPPTSETDAHYPALPPGSYTFKVRAMNRDGIWSEKPAEFQFTILPPWYKSWWFYTALFLAIGISLFSYIKVRERQLRLRNQILERKVEERTAEVVAQSKEIEGQKGRIEDLLLNILPKQISDELKEKGKATARHHDGVTVMFTDMKGFTQVAERMTPEELVNELDECFIHFDDIVGRYNIEKIKTIGDSYMCACGIPTSDDNHAIKMTWAALEVRELMDAWQRDRQSKGVQPWVLRIGLHSGPLVAGVVGKRKFAYDIWGDTVNTASRMESSGEPGEVNVSGATYAMIKDHFVCDHRGQIQAKNKGAIDMYFVRRLKPEYSADKTGLKPNARFLQLLGVAEEQFA